MSTITTPEPTKPSAAPPTAAANMRPRLVLAELRKILSTNTWWLFGIYVLAATALALLVNVVNANDQLYQATHVQLPQFPPGYEPTPEELEQIMRDLAPQGDVAQILARESANVFTSGQFFGVLLVMIIGVLVVTNEFAHQTATATFLTTPQRTKVITAKLGAAVGLGAGYWLLSTLFSVGVGALNFSLQGYDVLLGNSTVLRAIGMNLLAYGLLTVFGVGLGVLIRSQLGATLTAAGLYLLSFPAGVLVIGFIRQFLIHDDRIWNFMVAIPGIAAMVMVSPEPLVVGADQELNWYLGANVLLLYALVAGTVGTLIARKRDIS